ncbi:hypothetical protein AMATHDRAFT_79092 [Amanita thiersii Skay4041]|uniref:Nuclear pore complex protein n=1 Tax=Amanita thiersii Skay4041 TaxID=703135 RepID=A0A2A9NZW8_9AGAR|nr:hypothetical protein AMATHDRAFT_79092 [Amanita thiersii Skay4041]
MSLFAVYADVLALSQPTQNDLRALLHPLSGYAPRIAQICKQQLTDLQDAPNASSQDIELLRLEHNTWLLLQVLMAARKTATPPPNFVPNPYTPTSTLAQAILRSSQLLTELVIVREWLHETAPQPAIPEATTGYLNFTKHAVMQDRRLNRNPTTVDHLDPDAPNRPNDSPAQLASDDASYERSLLQALYGHIRAGRLEDAIELSRRAHQPWRAASIRGALLFRWNAISTDPADAAPPDDEQDNNLMDQDAKGPGLDVCSGNRNRRLWKSTCTRAALNPNLSTHERILHASLAPSPQTFPILHSVCKTWEDHLWATLSVICEQRESAELSRLAVHFGSFWEEQIYQDPSSNPPSPPPPPPPNVSAHTPNVLNPIDEDDWEKEVNGSLASLASISVAEGPPADHAFHFSQLHIILGRTSTLLDVFAGGLQDGSYGPETYEYTPLCRFFAHLCLFFKMIDIPVPPLATQAILEAYLRVLEDAGERRLIALYAGALGENAVERYALFLVSLGLTLVERGDDAEGDISMHDNERQSEGDEEGNTGDSLEERKRALARAKEHGLDVNRVAIVAAEQTVDKAFELLLPTSTKGPLPSLVGGVESALQRPASPAETFLMRSIEWTSFSEATYDTALEQACVILRFFLASGRIRLAQRVLEMLPAELTGIAEPEERATEYLHYRQFFVVWETLERVVACQALEVDMDTSVTGAIGASRETRTAWLADYKSLIDQAAEQVTRLLTAEWLVVDSDDGSQASNSYGGKRRQELIRIRRIFIPELVIRLHSQLFASRRWFPENLKRALQLANIVADSRYKLHEDFLGMDIDNEMLNSLQRTLEEGVGRGGEPSTLSSAVAASAIRIRRRTRLSDYLSAVRYAVLGALEGGGSDLFAWVTKVPVVQV